MDWLSFQSYYFSHSVVTQWALMTFLTVDWLAVFSQQLTLFGHIIYPSPVSKAVLSLGTKAAKLWMCTSIFSCVFSCREETRQSHSYSDHITQKTVFLLRTMGLVLLFIIQSFAGLTPLRGCYTTAKRVPYIEAVLENPGNNTERILRCKKIHLILFRILFLSYFILSELQRHGKIVTGLDFFSLG